MQSFASLNKTYDGRIDRPYKQTKDSTTSPSSLPIYAAASVPLGSGLTSVAYAERNGMHYLSLPTQESGTSLSGRRVLPRIEERERVIPIKNKIRKKEKTGRSDLRSSYSQRHRVVCGWTKKEETQASQREVNWCQFPNLPTKTAEEERGRQN